MKNSTKILSILLSLLMLSLSGMQMNAADGNHSISAKIDSAYIIMGRTTPIHVEVVTTPDAKGMLFAPSDTLVQGVEVRGRSAADTTDAGNGKIRITQDLIIQSFDSGNYVIPPIRYIVDNETIKSDNIPLKVLPVNVDTMTTVHPLGPVIGVPAHFWDWVPDWIADYWGWWLLLIILIVGATLYYHLWWKKRDRKSAFKPIIPQPAPEPPYELAIKRLNALSSEKLWENGQDKEFYVRLTDILRQYIDSRFSINAMEMTSDEILRALRSNAESRLPEKYMRQVLEIADYVKFAKMKPFSEDNIKAYNDAMQFVEDTKPKPVIVPEKQQGQQRPDKINNTEIKK